SPSTTLFRSEGVLVALGVLCGTVGGLVKGHLTLALLGQGERELLQRRPRDRRGAAVIEDRHVSLGIGGHVVPETVRLLRIIFQLGEELGALKESANALDPGFGSFDQPRDTLPRAHGRSLPSLAAVFTPALRQCAQSHPPAIPASIPRHRPRRYERPGKVRSGGTTAACHFVQSDPYRSARVERFHRRFDRDGHDLITGLRYQATEALALGAKHQHQRFGRDRKSTRLNSSHVSI